MSELTRLAKHVYLLTQDEVWRGGKGGTLPHRLQEPKEFHNRRSYWTVSPDTTESPTTTRSMEGGGTRSTST